MLDIYGFINRGHLMRKYDISQPQASQDLQAFARAHPRVVQYDGSRKAYVRVNHPEGNVWTDAKRLQP